MTGRSQLHRLVVAVIGEDAAEAAFSVLRLSPALDGRGEGLAPRATLAMALNVCLFHDLLQRTPTAAAYVQDRRSAGEGVIFDHGALRTIRFAAGPTGALPPGEAAFTRIFEPLGYVQAGVYPLERLGMTGRAYAHADAPQDVPQFFLSELHVERFGPEFEAAAHRVFDSSRDPLDPASVESLSTLAERGELEEVRAIRLLPVLASAFARLHGTPRLADYRALLARSAEAAWIATEGAAFNHATDRVADVDVLAAAQKALGRPMKPEVEVSQSGRVRQTAFRADAVLRTFLDDEGREVRMQVPGSFYEFITRDEEAEGRLDLRFDSANAQGIFKMTAAATA
jgi:hypothetical protein